MATLESPSLIGPIVCSFCRKDQHEVAGMMAGPDEVYICDECVEVCAEVMADAIAKRKAEAAKQGVPEAGQGEPDTV